MKRIYLSLCMLAVLPVAAQETYENANIATQDLNGTARYVGMGGAMEALGADISTISTNPAGVGLFRSSQVTASAGIIFQGDVPSGADGDKTHVSFDQIGFVISRPTASNSFVNFAFNYHKSRNFNQLLSATGNLADGASQNKLSYIKGTEGLFDLRQNLGEWVGNSNAFNQLDFLYYNTVMNEVDADGNTTFIYEPGSAYLMNRQSKGYIGEYDFNISGNIKDRVYLGLTFGIHDVHYKMTSTYAEAFLSGNTAEIYDDRKITGTGFDVKAGIIFRPIETSPFRIGLSVATPVFYDLSTDNYTTIASQTGYYKDGYSSEKYDFKVYTPWRFGLSLGHTIGSNIALGASYEYADYSSMDNRIDDGDYYDWYYDSYYESSSHDHAMNRHTENTLKGVSTLKLGVEYKPFPELALRAGYNYVSPMYKKGGYKDGSVDSPGSYYASATDYTNWKSTNRLTLGVGYTWKKFTADLAYQYSAQSGDFYPFMSYYGDDSNIADAKEVDNNRHQVLLTLGYRF